MIIFSNGCSHTAGACRFSSEDSYATLFATSIFGKNNFKVIKPEHSENTLNSFNKTINQLKEDENYLIFQADYGKPNELIFFETYHFINECISKGIKVDYSIIQTSGPNRRLHFDESFKKIYVNPHDNVEYGLRPEPYGSSTTLQYIKILQDLFISNNIEYCFIPYMEIDKLTWKHFSYKNLINFERFTTHPTIGHRNEFRASNKVCDPAGHPNLLGNYYLTYLILKMFEMEDYLIGFYDYYSNTEDGIPPNLGTPHNFKEIKENADNLGDGTLSDIKKYINNFKKLF